MHTHIYTHIHHRATHLSGPKELNLSVRQVNPMRHDRSGVEQVVLMVNICIPITVLVQVVDPCDLIFVLAGMCVERV
jgi:hypothetical protein